MSTDTIVSHIYAHLKTQYTPDWKTLKKFGCKVIQFLEETLTTHKYEVIGNAVYASNYFPHRKWRNPTDCSL